MKYILIVGVLLCGVADALTPYASERIRSGGSSAVTGADYMCCQVYCDLGHCSYGTLSTTWTSDAVVCLTKGYTITNRGRSEIQVMCRPR